MKLNLQEGVWKRARTDTLSAKDSIRFKVFVEIIVVAGFAAYFGSICPNVTGCTIFGGLFGFIIGAIPFFLINLVCAPYRQRNEARDEVSRRRIAEERQNEITVRIFEGDSLIKRCREGSEAPETIWDDVNQWNGNIKSYLLNKSGASSLYTRINSITVDNIPPGHTAKRDELGSVVKKIRDILQEFKEDFDSLT